MGSDVAVVCQMRDALISIHAPRMGSDRCSCRVRTRWGYFNPRSPDGERPANIGSVIYVQMHFNPRSPDGERPSLDAMYYHLLGISIHAPRMGSDSPSSRVMLRTSNFNPRSPDGERPPQAERARRGDHISIHAPRMGSDPPWQHRPYITVGFQSTLPGWGATESHGGSGSRPAISIHAPRMGSDSFLMDNPIFRRISIHAPRMGSDFLPLGNDANTIVFQSTLPGWGATFSFNGFCCLGEYFNPRSPDGERPRKWTSSPTIWAKSSIFNTDCIADRH